MPEIMNFRRRESVAPPQHPTVPGHAGHTAANPLTCRRVEASASDMLQGIVELRFSQLLATGEDIGEKLIERGRRGHTSLRILERGRDTWTTKGPNPRAYMRRRGSGVVRADPRVVRVQSNS
jgi:hypothetical protein